MCVAFDVNLYLKATEHVRGEMKKLLLSIVPPHKAVTTLQGERKKTIESNYFCFYDDNYARYKTIFQLSF